MPAPNKLFTVVNGNGLTIDAGTTKSEVVESGILIRFKSIAAKRKVARSFCKTYGWSTTVPDPDNPGAIIPNPVTENEFLHLCLLRYIKEIVRSQAVQDAINTAAETAGIAEDQDLP